MRVCVSSFCACCEIKGGLLYQHLFHLPEDDRRKHIIDTMKSTVNSETWKIVSNIIGFYRIFYIICRKISDAIECFIAKHTGSLSVHIKLCKKIIGSLIRIILNNHRWLRWYDFFYLRAGRQETFEKRNANANEMFKHFVLRRAKNEASNLNSRISRENRCDPINFMLSQSSRSFPLRCQSSTFVDRARRESFTRDYPPEVN